MGSQEKIDTGRPLANHVVGAAPDLERIVKIEIAENGGYMANGVPMERTALFALLKRYARLMPDAESLIRCQPESEHGHLVLFLSGASAMNLKLVKGLPGAKNAADRNRNDLMSPNARILQNLPDRRCDEAVSGTLLRTNLRELLSSSKDKCPRLKSLWARRSGPYAQIPFGGR